MTFYVSGLKFHRLPVCNSSSPTDEDYDLLVSALQGTKFNAPVIINCQVIIIIINNKCHYHDYNIRSASPDPLPAVSSPACSENTRSVDTLPRCRLHQGCNIHPCPGEALLRRPDPHHPRPQPQPAQDGHVRDGHGEGPAVQGRVRGDVKMEKHSGE